MTRRILIIDGHPDPEPERYLHALAGTYERAARAAGHEVRTITLSRIDFPWLRSARDFQQGDPPPAIREAQQWLAWCDHVVLCYPLWLGDVPALLKAFLEQLLRPGFAFAGSRGRGLPKKLLAGRSARIVVTMGMPALFYRWSYRSHSVRSLARNVLAFCGIRPVRTSVVGMVESGTHRRRWLRRMEVLGRRGG